MIARAMTAAYIVSELIFNTSFVFLTMWFTHRFGLRGVTYAFATNYALYLATMVCMFRNLLLGRVSASEHSSGAVGSAAETTNFGGEL
jgi:hypothetical protein